MPFALREFEGDAYVAVHQTQPVVVTGHQHRAPFIPLLVAVYQLAGKQRARNALVQTLHTPRAFSHGAEHLKPFECVQYGARPCRPARVFEGRTCHRALLAQDIQVMPIAFGFVPAALKHQTFKAFVLLATQWPRRQVRIRARGQ